MHWRENSINGVIRVPIKRLKRRRLFVKKSLPVTANKISNHATNICITQMKSRTHCGLGQCVFVRKPSKMLLKKIMNAVKDEAPLTATWLFNSVFGWCIVSKFELQ
jgi:hypothetical protein